MKKTKAHLRMFATCSISGVRLYCVGKQTVFHYVSKITSGMRDASERTELMDLTYRPQWPGHWDCLAQLLKGKETPPPWTETSSSGRTPERVSEWMTVPSPLAENKKIINNSTGPLPIKQTALVCTHTERLRHTVNLYGEASNPFHVVRYKAGKFIEEAREAQTE